MKPDIPLDYAVFQLSPRRSRCELIVSSGGCTEKLASGLVKPFITHLKVAEEQFALAVPSIKLEVGKRKNAELWFTKGTIERFVRFVSTPEVLELVNTFDAEMSQLEAARKIYSQGPGDHSSGARGDDEAGIAPGDATKKELSRAIDLRLAAVKQDLTTACARASAAGFNPDSVLELQYFADCFGAHRLNETCTNFLSFCQKRPELIPPWKLGIGDRGIRSSCESDMSLDDPSEDPSGPPFRSHQNQSDLNKRVSGQEQRTALTTQQDDTKAFTGEQPNSSPVDPPHLKKVEENDAEEKEKKDDTQAESPAIQMNQSTRRLSVQDRINLFESKQKENTGSGSGGKPVVGKAPELRRLSSDVSSAPAVPEKAVLRRWSGASDMSLDLSDKKDVNTESPLCTPSSASAVFQVKSNAFFGASEDASQRNFNHTANSSKNDVQSNATAGSSSQPRVMSSSDKEEEASLIGNSYSKDQTAMLVPNKSSLNSSKEQIERKVGTLQKMKVLSGEGNGVTKDQGSSEGQTRGYAYQKESAGVKIQAAFQAQVGASLSKTMELQSKKESGKTLDDTGEKDHPAPEGRSRGHHGHSRSFSGLFERGLRDKGKEIEDEEMHYEQLVPLSQFQPVACGVEGVGKDFGEPVNVQSASEESANQKMKLQMKRLQGKRDETGSSYGNSKVVLPSKRVSEGQETSLVLPSMPVEQVQRPRQSKGNQELNDELKMKANELERLFAEHKLRVPGDQVGSARRTKPVDTQKEQTVTLQQRKPVLPDVTQMSERKPATDLSRTSSNMENYSTPPSNKMVTSDLSDSLRKNFSDLSFSDDSRGKFYEKYMQKRDAKLREEWGSRRAEKEAKLKAMHDSLERSRAEMKAKFSGSADRKSSVSSSRHQAEKPKSFNLRSSVKREQPIDFTQSDDDEESSDYQGQKSSGQGIFSDASLGDGASRSIQMKKPNRNLSSSTPHTSAAPTSRSSLKAYNSSSGRRRLPSENPLAQSVPNFSDFRKENTKPSGASKTATRPQPRSFARSKSTTEDVSPVKEEKSSRSHSLRKSSVGAMEVNDFSGVNSEPAILAPLEFDKEQSNKSNKFAMSTEMKHMFTKGSGVDSGAMGGGANLKASMTPGNLLNDEYVDDSTDMVKDGEEEGFEHPAIRDNRNPRMSQESDDFEKSESENGDALTPLSNVDPASFSQLPVPTSKFHFASSLQDSPGESPVSWNSHVHLPFSYPNESSDVDASVDSPGGSPASWNSHPLGQTDDAARMRKKWGSAQKPFLVGNSSHNQSRKDVTKGFKRLLKFGRKSRGPEGLVDWISATTSEGDDDTEDGRDPGNRSSEDLRKSRMGFSQGPDDNFNESDVLNEQVQSLRSSIPAPPANFKLREDHITGSSLKAPRSFFSLSSFRSKGSDLKPR